MAKIEVNKEKCKGCELCVSVCQFGLVTMSDDINSAGNHYAAQQNAEKCVGCALCAVMCPDVCISVFKDVKKGA